MSVLVRLLNRRTPKAPPAPFQEENEDVNVANETEPELDASETLQAERADVTYVRLPLSDFPDFDSDSDDTQRADALSNRKEHPATVLVQPHGHARHVADMGANNSHEELSAAIRATADEIQNRNAAGRTSSGRLQRVSNPPYRNPVDRSAPTQRRLRASNQVRPDVYDVNDFQSNSSPLKRRQLEEPPQISPLRKKHRTSKQVQDVRVSLAEQYALEQQRIDEQLRSEEPDEIAPQSTSTPPRSQRLQEAEVEGHMQESAGAVRDTPHASQVKPWTPEEDQILVEGVRAGWSFSKILSSSGLNRSESAARGRKKVLIFTSGELKTLPRTSDGARVQEVAQEDKAETPKRKRGRPRKNAVVEPMQSQTSASAEAGQATIGAQHLEDNDSRTSTAKVGPQTRAQKAASASPQKPKKQNSVRAQRMINDRQPAEEAEDEGGAAAESIGWEDKRNDYADEIFVRQGGDADYQPLDDQFEDEDEDAAEAAAADGQDAPRKEPLAARKADHVKASELELGGDSDDEAESEKEEGGEEPQPKSTGRRGKTSTRSTANISRKRAREYGSQPEPSAATPDVPDIDDTPENQARLYGQWLPLQKVFRDRLKVGVKNDGHRRNILLKDREVKAIVELCDQVKATLQGLRDAQGIVEADQDPADYFADIDKRVVALYEEVEDRNFKDQRKIKCIYFHLFPRLVELVEDAVNCYEAMDRDASKRHSITLGHLKIVKDLIELIVELGEGVKAYDNPPTHLVLVRPVTNDIVAPLKKVSAAYTRIIRGVEHAEAQKLQMERQAERQATARRIQMERYEEERKARAQREADERALQLQREEQERRRIIYVRRVQNKWNALHMERMCAEGAIMSRQKREYLRVPNPVPEYDRDGMEFERVEVFTPRVGPPPAMVQQARDVVWSMAQLDALAEGLKQYRGPMVFERTFRRYCPKQGLLSPYSVTEIVTVAADLKEWLANAQQRESGRVEDWVKEIPVWTKGHPLGKENVDGVDVDVDDAGEA